MKLAKHSVLFLGLLCLLACKAETRGAPQPAAGASTQPQANSPQVASTPTASPGGVHKLALLVALNKYLYSDRISPLAGSVNDIEEMRQVLIGKFEFPPENILVLTDAQATHAAIINAIQTHLIAKAQPGDIVVFDYSGHGSQMKDVTGKMPNGLDETIVPYDSRDPANKVFDISGAELHPLLLQLAKKTKNLTFILDSCHSGGGLIRAIGAPRERSIPADTRTPPPLPSYSVAATREVGPVTDETSPKFAAIAAATSRESAFEHIADGKDHGALTYFLVRQLRSAKAGVTYRDIMDNVAGEVTAYYPNQHPSLEGVEADQYVFGDGSSLARTYVTASLSLITPRGVTVHVGQVQSASAGSTYDIYPPGSKRMAPPEKPIARVRLSSIGALTSEAKFVSGTSIATASRAVEREHQFGKLRMRIFLNDVEGSPTLQSIRTALQGMTNIELADSPATCNMQLKEVNGHIQTLGADFATLSTPIPTSDPNAADRIIGQVKQWARWFNVLSIRNPNSDIQLQFTLAGSQTRDPMARVGRPDMGVKEGEIIEATLTNHSERDVYVAILDLSSDGSIAAVYPSQQGIMQVLKPTQKISRTFRTFIPPGRSVVTDILKVFASYKPIDLQPLTQGTIRDIGQEATDPLQALLDDSSDGTRGLAPVLSQPVDLGSWATTQRVLVVRRK